VSIVFFLLAALFAGALAFGFKTGLMPTYLTGGAKRENEPVLYWIAAAVLALALLGSLWGGFTSL